MWPSRSVFTLVFFPPQYLPSPAFPLNDLFSFLCSQGVKPASFNKVVDPEIKEIIGECICQKKEER
jgi:hypothetical protein